MKDFEKILGAIFLVIAVVDLLRQDWLGFALLGLAGASLLLSKKLRLSKGVEIALALILFALLAARLIILFSR